MADRVCDGTTQYTCVVEVLEEEGKVFSWFGTDRDATEAARATEPPHFTFPFKRREEDWGDDCACPRGCKRFVRDNRTLDFRGTRRAWLRRAGDGLQIDEGKKVVKWWKVEVTFVCAPVDREEARYSTLTEEEASAEVEGLAHLEPGFTGELFEDWDGKA
jgi:hypothetical protein